MKRQSLTPRSMACWEAFITSADGQKSNKTLYIMLDRFPLNTNQLGENCSVLCSMWADLTQQASAELPRGFFDQHLLDWVTERPEYEYRSGRGALYLLDPLVCEAYTVCKTINKAEVKLSFILLFFNYNTISLSLPSKKGMESVLMVSRGTISLLSLELLRLCFCFLLKKDRRAAAEMVLLESSFISVTLCLR